MKNFLTSFSLLIFLVLFSRIAEAATYYFSDTDGDDSRSSAQAQSSSTPWKTLNKLNSIFSTLATGDQILFKRGDTFYGSITVSKSSISFGAYGSGVNPLISGGTIINSWTNDGGGVYETALSTAPAVVVVGNRQYAPGRTPNTGWWKMTSASGSSITSSSISGSFNGATVVYRENNSVITPKVITGQSGSTINFSSGSSSSGWGFFITNSLSALDQYGEWFFDNSSKKLKVFFGASGTISAIAATVGNLVTISNQSGTSFNNIDFAYTNGHVFSLSSANNTTISGCNLKFVGARGVNASNTSSLTITNSSIVNCNDVGIEMSGTNPGLICTNNLVRNIGTFPGLGGSSYDNYCGIVTNNSCANMNISNNIIDTVGYQGITGGATGSLVKNNFVNYFCFIKDDGGGIYIQSNSGTGKRITGNVVLNGIGAADGTTGTDQQAMGIYSDGGNTNTEIDNNTVAFCAHTNIYMDNSTNINIHDNTVYNGTRYGIGIDYTGAFGALTGLTVSNNICASNTTSAILYAPQNQTSGASLSTWGKMDNNIYARPLSEGATIRSWSGSGPASNYALAQWQSLYGYDKNSKVSPKTISKASDLRFEYNASESSKTINLGATYMDVAGKTYAGSISLAPYTSAVLIYVSGTVANQPPVANAGSNQTISQPLSSVSLDGSNSKDPDGTITTYAWTKVSGPGQGTITNTSGMTTTATSLAQGSYIFKLTVTDNGNATDADSVTITVNGVLNQTPVANAGANQTITLPTNSVMLNGNASSDPDGSIVSYAWSKVSGPSPGAVTSPAGATTTVTNLAQGSYVFRLAVTDNGNVTAADSVTIVVNAVANKLPVANAGANQTITLPTSSVTLNGSASSDPDGTISSYTWSKVSGPANGIIANAASATTTVTNLAQGTYVFKLTVKDNSNATDADSVIVTVNASINQPPVANAGANQTITLPTNTVTLNGSGSSDADGTIASYTWTKSSGPAQNTISSATKATTAVTDLVQGTYVFKLTIKDNDNATATDSVIVTVNAAANQPPVANAGSNQTITLPTNSVSLNGSASSDADGTISSYTWSKASGPAQGTISNAANASTTATNLVQGVYIFKLTVKDNSNATASDSIIITVNAAANQPPVANAGANQTITLPTNTVTLNGAASADRDGTIASYSWVKSSGPAQGTISNAASATTTVANLAQGIYIFKLTVKDDDNATATDSIIVTVNAAANQRPVANAGANQTITLPANSVTLDGSASSDADGSIVSYAWTKISGGTASIANAATNTTSVGNLQAGQYVFQLTVTDDDGGTATRTVRITVLNAADINPVADAGQSQTITLPVNSVILDGTGSVDPDGSISSYAWSKVSGPSQGTIVNAGNATTAVNNLSQGVYTFKLTVRDNNGNAATDSITVTVNAAINKLPIANAGTSQNIILPVNTANLDGSASTDPDGTIVSYSWVKISGGTATIANEGIAKTTVTDLTSGQYTFELTVTDDKGAIAKSQVKITVNGAPNQSPVANTGSNKTITLPVNTVTVDGSASVDPDGSIVSYKWVKLSGGAATITDDASATTTLTGLVAGQYTFELTVTDNRGATSKATMRVTVNQAVNKRPVANAGISQTITLPVNNANLDASGSSDADGNIVSYSWVKINGGTATIANADAATTTVSGLTAGQYTFEVTVTDDKGATSRAQVKITVIAARNQPPVANAGSNINVTLPTDNVTLDGSNSNDPDGTIVTYSWAKINGGAATIKNANTAIAAVSGLIAGQYTFELTVTDNNGATSKEQVNVTVNRAADTSPNADAGVSQTLPYGTVSTTLDGSKSSDPDGQIASYSWTLVSGAAATITNGNTAKPVVTGLQGGEYTFELTVTDDRGATATAQVKVIVNLSSNQAPVADAGSNQNVNFTGNTANTKLDGSKSYDPDGSIVSYAWTRIDGPSAVTVTNMNTATPIISGMAAGVYTFELIVTDNRGASTKAQVKITVRQSDNEPPVAEAGDDVTVTLPNSNNKGGVSVKLDGTKSYDPDGTIYSYSWLKLDGPSAVNITNINSSVANVSGLQAGRYTFQITVTDNLGASSTDEITVIVKPAPDQLPIADAGDDIIVTAPESTAGLDGSNSSDNQSGLTYAWEEISGPSTAGISPANTAKIAVRNLALGQYVFKLTVKNSRGTEASDEVKINVIKGTKGYATMDLYPNPASSVVNAKITSDSIGVVILNIYDMNGRAMKKVELNKQLVDNLRQQVQRRDVNNNPTNTTEVYFTFPINISALSNGVYILETIIDQKVKIASKFVKY